MDTPLKPGAMSTKARLLLGDLDANEERSYKMSSSRGSRRSSFALSNSSTPGRRHAEQPKSHLLPLLKLPELPPAEDELVDEPLPYPHFSILSGGRNKKKAITSSPGMPALAPRHSTSTLRSFAPPTIPTYKPRPGSFNYVPHASRDENRHAPHSAPSDPWALPKPLDTAYSVSPFPPPQENENILRKALSIISLRSRKSETLRPNTARSGSRLNPQFESPSFDRPPLPQFPLPPGTPPKLSRNTTSEAIPRIASRSRLNITTVVGEDDSRNPSRTTSHPAHTTDDAQLGHKSKEWFDGLSEEDGGEAKTVPDDGWVRSHDVSRNGQKRLSIGAARQQEQQHKVHKRNSSSINIHKRGGSKTGSRDATRPINPAHRRLRSGTTRSHQSVIYDQTMVDISDSDDSATANETTRSTKSKKSTDSESDVRAKHEARTRGRRPGPSTTGKAGDENRGLSFENGPSGATDDSAPSLIGSTSSIRDSIESSSPRSPSLASPHRQPSQDASATRDSRLPTPEDDKEFAKSIITELKHGSRINRIIAAISPEEAILIAKIRRNRADALLRLSVLDTPVSTPRHGSRPSSMIAARHQKSHSKSQSRSDVKTPSTDTVVADDTSSTARDVSAAEAWAARRIKAHQKASHQSKQSLPLQFPVVPGRTLTRASSFSVRQPGSQQAPGSRMSVMGNLLTSSMSGLNGSTEGHNHRESSHVGNIVTGNGGSRIPLVIGTGRKIPVGRVQERKDAWELRQREKASGATTPYDASTRTSSISEAGETGEAGNEREESTETIAVASPPVVAAPQRSMIQPRPRRNSPSISTPPPVGSPPPLPPSVVRDRTAQSASRSASRATTSSVATIGTPGQSASPSSSLESPPFDMDLESRPTTPSTIRHVSIQSAIQPSNAQLPSMPISSPPPVHTNFAHTTAADTSIVDEELSSQPSESVRTSSEASFVFMNSPASDDSAQHGSETTVDTTSSSTMATITTASSENNQSSTQDEEALDQVPQQWSPRTDSQASWRAEAKARRLQMQSQMQNRIYVAPTREVQSVLAPIRHAADLELSSPSEEEFTTAPSSADLNRETSPSLGQQSVHVVQPSKNAFPAPPRHTPKSVVPVVVVVQPDQIRSSLGMPFAESRLEALRHGERGNKRALDGAGDAMKAWLEMCGGGGTQLEAW